MYRLIIPRFDKEIEVSKDDINRTFSDITGIDSNLLKVLPFNKSEAYAIGSDVSDITGIAYKIKDI